MDNLELIAEEISNGQYTIDDVKDMLTNDEVNYIKTLIRYKKTLVNWLIIRGTLDKLQRLKENARELKTASYYTLELSKQLINYRRELVNWKREDKRMAREHLPSSREREKYMYNVSKFYEDMFKGNPQLSRAKLEVEWKVYRTRGEGYDKVHKIVNQYKDAHIKDLTLFQKAQDEYNSFKTIKAPTILIASALSDAFTALSNAFIGEL